MFTWIQFLAGALTWSTFKPQVDNIISTVWNNTFGLLFGQLEEDDSDETAKTSTNLLASIGVGLIVALIINYSQKRKII